MHGVKQTDPSSNFPAGSNLTENPAAAIPPHIDASPALGKRPVIDCGDLDMRIARDGTWFYRGSPIGRLPLVKLFASVLRREYRWRLLADHPSRARPYRGRRCPVPCSGSRRRGQGRDQHLIFRTNLDEFVTAGPDKPLRVETAASGEPAPYIQVRDGLEARIARPVFYDLVELGIEEQVGGITQFGVWSAGMFFVSVSLDRIGSEKPSGRWAAGRWK